jgi:plastocyanin
VSAPRRSFAALAAVVCLGALDATGAGFEARVRSPAGAPVEDAAVVLEPVSGKLPQPKAQAFIEQRDREFVPYLSIVQKGAAVHFPNRDKLKHHVYSFSPAKTFEIKLYAGQPAQPVIFDKAGEVALGCNIHDWMEAHMLVVDSPWFGKTGADGIARIAQVPAGRYRLRVWHPRQKAAAAPQDVMIGATPGQRAELALDVAPREPHDKPPLDSGSY